MKKVHSIKGTVRLVAFDRNGNTVSDERLVLRRYFEESNPLLDEIGFRKERRITGVRGTIYDAAGAILEEFKVRYDDRGCSVEEATRLPNGTATGNWERV